MGNKCFNEKNYIEAIDNYLNAVAIFRYYCPRRRRIETESKLNSTDGDQVNEVRSALNILLLNLTACYLAKKDFHQALRCVEESLLIDPTNAKAWYRKAKAFELTEDIRDLKAAIDCLKIALTYSQGTKDEPYFLKLLHELSDKYFTLTREEEGRKGIKHLPPFGHPLSSKLSTDGKIHFMRDCPSIQAALARSK